MNSGGLDLALEKAELEAVWYSKRDLNSLKLQ